jgi:hypothetical protein
VLVSISFDSNGNPIPYRAIELTLEDFERIFTNLNVERIRQLLFSNLRTYVERFSKEITPSSLWIMLFDGSYTTRKSEPNDIDFVSIIDLETFETKAELLINLTTRGNKERGYDIRTKWGLDAYVFPYYPPNDPRFIATVRNILYWVRWFGKDRKKSPKAIFVVKLINRDNLKLGAWVRNVLSILPQEIIEKWELDKLAREIYSINDYLEW